MLSLPISPAYSAVSNPSYRSLLWLLGVDLRQQALGCRDVSSLRFGVRRWLIYFWMAAPTPEALKLHRLLPNGDLKIVAGGDDPE